MVYADEHIIISTAETANTTEHPHVMSGASAEEGKPELKDLRQLIGEISDGEGKHHNTGQRR